MGIKFKTITRLTPHSKKVPKYVHTFFTGIDATYINTLAKLNINLSTITDTDCAEVLRSFQENCINEMSQSKIMKLGSLVNFHASRSANEQEKKEVVTANNLVKSRNFFGLENKYRTLWMKCFYQEAG